MDEGWTRCVLDRYEFDYTKLHNEDIKPGKLRQRFDAIILPDQRTNSITRRSRLQDHRRPSIAAASASRLDACASSSPKAARWSRSAKHPTCWWTSSRSA